MTIQYLFPKRLNNNPLVTPGMLPNRDGENINGPSVIKTPKWLKKPLGKFYLYFAHHRGSYIRLAFADHIEGPWKIYTPGTLRLSDCTCVDHIASPDVHIDEDEKKIRMYFHGVDKSTNRQSTYIATSDDGLQFKTSKNIIADFYLKVVAWNNLWIGVTKGGVIHASTSKNGPFQKMQHKLFKLKSIDANDAGDIRHLALNIFKNTLYIYFTCIGDMAESIYEAEVSLANQMALWKIKNIKIILKPTEPYEGSLVDLKPSLSGASSEKENALRDPAVLNDDGKQYLFYAVAGESGIAAAEIFYPATKNKEMLIDNSHYLIDIPNPLKQSKRFLLDQKLISLQKPEVLSSQLNLNDQITPIQRIYIMGCGRSGTWLLTSIFSTMKNVSVVPEELNVEYFGCIHTTNPTLILKRFFNSYEQIENIPSSIKIAYIIRHPFDVLTSHNPTTAFAYHISPSRWIGEIYALKFLIESHREGVKILKYEDLVDNPHEVQNEIANFFSLTIDTSTDDIVKTFYAPDSALKAMHGLRKIDKNSVGKYRLNSEKIAYLKKIKLRLGSMLDWISKEFNYDINI